MMGRSTSDKKLSDIIPSPKLGDPFLFRWFRTDLMTLFSQEEVLISGLPPKVKVGVGTLIGSAWVMSEKVGLVW